ncbi:10637_t:CDS:2 [Acaulospora colombiana]|uniref:10637_t:CDS:1 n=1 Tax=Acaulospora colombiana TaxID=27376 RepID=A0ACA9JVK8_9GLOM|nr:10637_t:CDS:2 [Acaulospora colombiana]
MVKLNYSKASRSGSWRATNHREKCCWENSGAGSEVQEQVSIQRRVTPTWSIRWFIGDFRKLVDLYPRGRFLMSNNFTLEDEITKGTGYDCRIRLFPNGNWQYVKPGFVSLYLQASPIFGRDAPQGIFHRHKIIKMEILRFNQNSYVPIKSVHLTLDNAEKNGQNCYGVSKFCRTESILLSAQDFSSPIDITVKITIMDSPVNEMALLEPFLYNDRFSDVEFRFECRGKLRAHKVILASRSKYFEKLFDENKSSIVETLQVKDRMGKLSTDKIRRKITGLLNKLLWSNLDHITKRITDFVNLSKDENDGHTLRTVIAIIFDHACQCSNYSHLYAYLCRNLMNGIDQSIADRNVKMSDGTVARGRNLFLKCLYTKCQLEFEKGCNVDFYIKRDENGESTDATTNEHFLGLKERRRWIGLARFFTELFKCNIVTESMMHRCVKHCLNKTCPYFDQIELLCEILRTVGKFMDHEKAKAHMDAYFERIIFFAQHPQLNEALRSKLMNIVELRENNWVSVNEQLECNELDKMIVENNKSQQSQNQDISFYHIRDVDYKTFKRILYYIYTGRVDSKLDIEILKSFM